MSEAGTPPPLPVETLSERIEGSPAAQTLISFAIVALLLALVGTHLPARSAIHGQVSSPANHIVRLAGAEQSWGVFAPNPRRTSLQIEGRVTFADGSTEVWTLPRGPKVVANLRFYRWRKWLERARSDSYRSIWDPTARWIASLYDDRASPVVRVELVRRFHDNTVAGDTPPWEEFTYYTLRLAEDE